jgi:membrane protein YqaA with SNARE-associated domain
MVILVATRRNPWYEYAAAATVGGVIGAYITFRLSRKAGKAYLESKFGQKRIPELLKTFERWGTGVLVASSAIPFPLPTSAFFAAAGASNGYSTSKFVTAVAVSRAVRYSVIALIAHLYGRHVLRVMRHPTQYWGWLLLFSGLFVALMVAAVVLNRRIAEAA